MSLTITTGIPCRLTVGDAASFLYSTSLYGAPDWTAQIIIKDGVGNIATFNATADGADHLFELTNANTATLKPGLGTATVTFSDGTNRQTSSPQNIWIDPDPTAVTVPSTAQKIVDEL